MFYIKETTAFSTAHKRATNQDRAFYLVCDGAPGWRGKMSILCVLDGVSNSNGEDAVRIASGVLRTALLELFARSEDLLQMDDDTREGEIHRLMCNAICAADQALRKQQQLQWREFATTVTLAVVFHEVIYTANAGDSPAYLLRMDLSGRVIGIVPLFECHNKAGESVRRGLMTPEQALTHPDRNALMRMIGSRGIQRSEIYTASEWMSQSDVLLLGSDGALAVFPEAAMCEVLEKKLRFGLEEAIESLYEKVNDSSSTDNFTVLAQWLEST